MTCKLLVSIVFIINLVQKGQSLVPWNCDSYYYYLYPERCEHSSCSYSEWSTWNYVEDSVVDVPTFQCSSGQAYSESRTRSAQGYTCLPQYETRQICLPDDTDRLIEALCLGNVQITLKIIPYELDLGTSVINTKRSSLRWCPETDGSKYICTEPPYTDGKRSLAREYRRVTKLQKRSEPVPLPTDPIPYSSEEHSTRFRRQSNPQCSSNDNQFILYLLDTSGSIGESDFNLTRDAIAKLIPLFCKDIQVAVMTFNHQFKLEFCFNCYGRGEVGNAIKDIIYRGGGTNTAGASKCACDELLTPQCGLDCDANCIDVVYITDGGSNDPSLEVCEEVKCLHNHVRGVNVHVVGIGSYNQNELNCIENSSRGISLFKYDTAADFNQAIGDVAAKLQRFSSTYQCTCANK